MKKAICQILSEEGELLNSDGTVNIQNITRMMQAADFKNSHLLTEDGDLFLTVDSLISINNIITNSNNICLRKCEVKPAGYDKQYMISTKIESELYTLVDEFNERKISARDFCTSFLNEIHPFKDGNGRTCKVLFLK